MRRFFLGILLPILLLLAVGGGVWWFVRSRVQAPTPPSSTQAGASVTPAVAAQALPPPARPQGILVENVHAPTAADREASRAVEEEPFEAELVEPGEPTHLFIPGYLDDPAPPPTSAAIPTASAPPPTSVSGDADQDGDGLTTDQELQQGTIPTLADSDRDGLTDGDEVRLFRSSPTRADTDGDGVSDGDEVHTWHTDPLNPDSDGDGYTDGSEISAGYNPNGAGRL